ncbi:MAG: Inner membrane protein YpjD [uncultured Ramlibacter sp.]|uniref:Inner membrane protein YpjD n=1 Tax=uncultured Ramlibacter sp. TaxID=260755 RepID=A0A6J4PAH1_9BURK|nr:MAG: Inner membrane protein YpjD [uncultured Ramlibacter sp.]
MILASGSGTSVALSLAAAAAYAVPAAASSRLSPRGARWALLAAWLLHALVLAWALLGDSPRFGFAPALSVTAWLVLTVYAVEREVFPQLQARWALAGLGSAAVLLALVFPGTPLHPSASALLPLHWALGIASYGLFGVAVVHAWLMRRSERLIRQAAEPQAGVPLLTLERITFRFVAAGFVLLTATLLAGLVFGERFYGRAWRWDHKTVFSVLAWLVFALLLLGRARFGWRGRKAVRVLYTGSLLLLLAYVGSRFVLEVVLGRPA